MFEETQGTPTNKKITSNTRTKKQKNSIQQAEPHDKMLFDIEQFLSDIECIQDMFSMVLPSLIEAEDKRKNQIAKTLSQLKHASKSHDPSLDQIWQYTKIFTKEIRKFKKTEVMFRSHALVCLVSLYDHFLSNILKNAYRKNPGQAISSDRALTYDELLALDSLDNVIEAFIVKEIDGLLREAHDKQLSQIDSEFKLGIKESFTELPFFIELAERRNIFVHNGGIVNRYYIEKCKKIGYPLPKELKTGFMLDVPEEYFKKAVQCLFELGVHIGFPLACRIYPDKLDTIHNSLINNVGFPLLLSENWEIARRVFSFVLSWPSKFMPNEGIKRIYIINNALSMSYLGQQDQALKLLSEYDWSSQGEKFQLAISVLRQEWTRACKIMSSMNGKKPFSENDFRTWPIFKKFRSTKEFRQAYKTLYGKRFVVRLSKETKEELERLLKQKK